MAWWASIVLLLGIAPSICAQVTVVSLGEVSAGAGAEVIVPVLLNPASSETKIGSITAAISFDPAIVSFLRAEKGFLLDGVNGKIQAEQRESARDPGASAVRFTVATEGEPRKPLREGLVLSLIFRIRPEATANTKVALRFQELSAATVDEPPRPVEPLTGTPGSVEVLSPESVPYVACFFFSH